MSMREIVDSAGVRWLVWDILPEEMHPVTRYEDYMQDFAEGWLVFETADGGVRRRLSGVPTGWAEVSDDDLLRLMDRAELTRAPKTSLSATVPPPSHTEPPITREDASPRPIIRSFLYPGGRIWAVAEVHDGARVVLRFSAGRRTLDLHSWPLDWAKYGDEQLADLLSRSFPRLASEPSPGMPARRRTDSRS